MNLGAFSISLSVKDLQKSKDFYEKLGFSQMAGNIDHNYLIMKSGDHIIGLFQAMFDGNMLTFNPGWDQNAQNLDSFDDVREIQKRLKEQGLELQKEADENTSGSEHIYLKDPDGNMILIDQHR